jgi:hypothetical protein
VMPAGWGMIWKGNILGAALGTVAALMTACSPHPKIPADETMTLSDKEFYDSATVPMWADDEHGMVTFSGTVSDESRLVVGKNNTLTAKCVKDKMECELGTAEQISADQFSRIDLDTWKITQWTPSVIVAEDERECFTRTINIVRKSESVTFVEVPTNQATVVCSKSDAQIRKYELVTSLGRQRLGMR